MILRFVEQPPGMFKRLIGLAQYGSKLSHVDAVTPEGTYIGAHLIGGVQELQPGYDVGFKEETFVNLETTPEQDAVFFEFLRAHLNEPYDPIAIVYFWGPFSAKNWQDPSSWTCTEFIAEGLIACGWLPRNAKVPAIRITPRDLYWYTSNLEAMTSGGING